MRRRMIGFLVAGESGHVASTVAANYRIPESTCRRHLEDLVSLAILDRFGEKPVMWRASKWLKESWPS